MAGKSNEDAYTLEEVRQGELDYIAMRRGQKHGAQAELKKTLIGLALSGGGIRSATTNLGILQGLAKMRILPRADYLSTVSGGGYIGCCLSALLSLNKQSVDAPGNPGQCSFKEGDEALFTTEWEKFPFREDRSEDRQPVRQGDERSCLTGKAQVKHLRTHGNFLMVRHGLLARETMRSIGNLLTGIVYHFFVVLVALMVLSGLYMGSLYLLVPDFGNAFPMTRLLPGPWETLEQNWTVLQRSIADSLIGTRPHWPITLALVLGVVLAVAGYFWLRRAFGEYEQNERAAVETGEETAQGEESGGTFLSRVPDMGKDLLARVLNPRRIIRGESEEDWFERRLLWQVGSATVIAACAIVAMLRIFGAQWHVGLAWLFIPVVVFVGAWIGSVVCVLVVSWTPRNTRGFRSLFGSFQALLSYGGLLSLGLALLPVLVFTLAPYTFSASVGELIGAGFSLLAARLLARQAGGTEANGGGLGLKGWLLKFALGVAVALFVLFIVLLFCSFVALTHPWLWFLGATAVFVLCGFAVNFNKLALHYFYRDRLNETYLRTEVDDGDGRMIERHNTMELPLTHLHGVGQEPIWGSTAPYHLVSTAINLSGSRDLTRKDRKSGYFLFSKLFCGSPQTGYRRTQDYRSGETKLARAMTISGAAVNSAMGFYTFFAQAFATTLFNLRLGYWLENPARGESRTGQEDGVFWPKWLYREMLTDTRASDRLVNLSDGGHTGDNVGIYPLLQRRCKVIIACDAEADTDLNCGSFNEALRHAYVDEGVDVDIDLSMIRRNPETGFSQNHCAIGRIRYPDCPDQQSWLVYLKSSLSGDEPEPVLNYAREYPAFPHETTADQFFSDSQFESYRALGVHIAEATFGRWAKSGSSGDWHDLQCLHSPFKASDSAEFQKTTDALMQLEQMFLNNSELKEYHDQCNSGAHPSRDSREFQEAEVASKVNQACMIQTQLMEQVFFALHLDRYANAPDNQGWMNLFRRWGNSIAFKQRFKTIKETFSSEFVEFYEQFIEDRPSMDKERIPHPWDDPQGNGIGIFLDPGRREVYVPPTRSDSSSG